MADLYDSNQLWDSVIWDTPSIVSTMLTNIITQREGKPWNSIFNPAVAEPGVGEFKTYLRENLESREK